MTTQKKLRKFRLKSGGHSDQKWVEAEPGDEDTGRLVEQTDPFTGKKSLRKLVRTSYEPVEGRDIVESTEDLVTKFGCNPDGVYRFEEVTDEGQPVVQESINVKLLKKMTVAGLRDYAAEEEIDVEGLELKADLIEAIQAAYNPAEEDLQPA